MSQRIGGLNSIASRYEAIFCDVWGVIHNGRDVYQSSVEALVTYRASGGKVVLITNSPRPSDGVRSQLSEMGVDRNCYDAIVTSGDVTRTLISQAKGPIFHLGPDRDLPLYTGLDIELANEDECASVVCSGMFDDENERPDEYVERLQYLVDRDIPFICANPDLVVERGDQMIFCAGSLAKLYEELGGKTIVAGKPHAPIYALASKKLGDIAGVINHNMNVVAIGDGLPTDVAGAINNGFDLIYISSGIHHAAYGTPDQPDEVALNEFLDQNGVDPTYWIPRLNWGTTGL